jgi:hypothetical protein
MPRFTLLTALVIVLVQNGDGDINSIAQQFWDACIELVHDGPFPHRMSAESRGTIGGIRIIGGGALCDIPIVWTVVGILTWPGHLVEIPANRRRRRTAFRSGK